MLVGPAAAPKALVVVRLSRMTDESTSPERQRRTCEELCSSRGYDVIGVAEDLDVSAGSTSPFDRPSLRGWLAKPEEYDVIVFYRVDRLVRRMHHLTDMIRWSEDYGVNLVSASESHFDLSTPVGKVIAQLVASFGEMELEAISERNSNAFRHNVKAGKWRGGVPPWGYLPEQQDDGTWKYVQDTKTAVVIRSVVDRVLGGEPLRAIAHDLTERGVPTAKDRFAEHQGRKMSGYQWHPGPLKRSLSSPTLLGYAVTREPLTDDQGRIQRDSNGKKKFGPETVVRADDGSPIIRAEPILTVPVFERMQAELGSRENRKEPTKRSQSLLLQVIKCGVCGRPAYRLKGGTGRAVRYRCASAQYKSTCGNRTIREDYADDVVESLLLTMLGESERKERVRDSGSDHSAELAELDSTLTDLVEQLGTGPFKAGTPQRIKLDQRIAELAARQEELSKAETKAAGWTWQPTGELFSQWWERQTTEQRNIWLRTMGVELTWTFDGDEKEPNVRLNLGDLETLGEQIRFRGAAAMWGDVLSP
ncbi:recombinase family protein [Rhodococcus sp. 05-2254-6]|uniref:recombinase family protein n=1 Tax=Rhodococcus sp. 05-2254-6 TaxID=2022489 RepID=UPI000B9A247E|nr:recombinase family protein [Rhodococcus sp. 05-2254-6]